MRPVSRVGRYRAFVLIASGLVLWVSCISTVSPERKGFNDLHYSAAATKYRKEAEQRFETRDISYPLSLLDYAVTSFYAGNLAEAKQAFFAVYRIDEGNIPEAAKFYQWLVVDGRKVYRLNKRERELLHLYLGLIYLAEDNLPEALVEFKKLRLRDQDASQLPVVNFYMGLVYEKLGRYDDARIEYEGLKKMDAPGLEAEKLLERVKALKEEREQGQMGAELIVQVDHHSDSTEGPTLVYADGRLIAKLPAYSDRFQVQLTSAEAVRQAAQKATARATREGLRCCGTILAEYLFPRHGETIGDLAGDLVLGDEEDDRDHRRWRYAPVSIAVARLQMPAETREIRLDFYDRSGEQLGSCHYPLSGEHRRVLQFGQTYFIVAGLAPEFFSY